MASAIPSIACLGVIGRNNNPLHISIFPSYDPRSNSFTPLRTSLQFSLLLSSSLDMFELRSRQNATGAWSQSGDFGLLHAVDERLAAYGFETNTGVRFVVVVDMRGRRLDGAGAGPVDAKNRQRLGAATVGLRDGEMKPVFKAMQAAYVKLLQNPFFDPDDHSPPSGRGGRSITSSKFARDMRRIGESWTPGLTTL